MGKRNGLSVKSLTKIVACTSVLKAFICICRYYGYIDIWSYGSILMDMICWITISVFFFTLYKNMK